MNRTLVLGVGNVLLMDEGIGVHVVRALDGRLPESAQALDGGTQSFALAALIDATDGLIVVDAAEVGAAPGDVDVFEGEAMDRYCAAGPRRGVHEIALTDLLAAAALSDGLPARRALVGIRPQQIEWGDTPSTEVADAIPKACSEVLALIARWAA